MRRIIEKRDEDGTLVYRLNKNTKKGEYFINSELSKQYKYCESVKFEGFDVIPSGFYKNKGYGLTNSGSFLLQELYDAFEKKVNLTITKTGDNHFDGRGSTSSVTINHSDLSILNLSVRSAKRIKNEEIIAQTRQFLGRLFSQQFREYKGAKPKYAPGTLASTLHHDDLLNRLNQDDREMLESFIPDYLSSIPGTLRAKKKLQVIFDALDAGQKIYLEKILREFRKKLSAKTHNEATWQKFLSNYILILRNTYGEVLEKASVSIQGKYPDFMLIDPYSYLDIYEIKKPNTELLQYDKSRNNYYWSTELSKAIAQVENYLYQVQRHSDSLIIDIKKAKGLDISIVRPRGYIISGLREQLIEDKKRDDFRILNEGLKNIDVIFYDDLLENLDTFLNRSK